MCSRLCHDIVGPIGAINAGLELINEEGSEDGALSLMNQSAGEVTRRVSFFRTAFGLASGRTSAGGLTIPELRNVASGLFSSQHARLEWPGGPHEPEALYPVPGKVLLNMVLIASEALPHGGAVAVNIAELPEGVGVAVTATGKGARLRDDVAAALNQGYDSAEVSARNVHAYFGQYLARTGGGQIDASRGGDDEVRLMALFPVR